MTPMEELIKAAEAIDEPSYETHFGDVVCIYCGSSMLAPREPHEAYCVWVNLRAAVARAKGIK